ncbi:hypothetical protein HH303_08855 [Rhodospirillaceae bacterium KN72]|uniref:Polyketide cyclase n=1 Tax=Pacificispira spongiicola TaxID=2729598 RepID=A0A7Y0HFH5_9PROT|nr:hypothetical protein [Pacificispira spongiicola]NMM44588.1 hypothetical protein [Pacificispira spongiicola]
MTDKETKTHPIGLEFEYELDAPPQKVWRALSIRDFRKNWLPTDTLADPAPSILTPGRQVRYRMRDAEPPFLESLVTFTVDPAEGGGTMLRIVHDLTDVRVVTAPKAAANNNGPVMMLAA